MKIIYTSRDYGYNIQEFLSELNEDSQIDDDAENFLENYVNDHIRYIHDTYSDIDFESQYNEAETVEDEEKINKAWIKNTLSSLDRFKSPLVKEIKKWMKYVANDENDDINTTIDYMYRSQEAYLLNRFLKNISSQETITLKDVQNVLEKDVDLKDFLQQVEKEYNIIQSKEKEESELKYNKEIELKNKNDNLLFEKIMKDLSFDEDPLIDLNWNEGVSNEREEKLRVVKRLVKPLFQELKSVKTIEEALELNDTLFEGKLGRFLHSKMEEQKTFDDVIAVQLHILARIISHFIGNNYDLLYLNISNDYYGMITNITETNFKEYETTPLITEVKYAIKEYLPSHKLFDKRGDFHNVRKDLESIIKESKSKDSQFADKKIYKFTPLAIEILHSALIHLFGTNNNNIKFGGDTRKVFSSFLNQVKIKDIKDASTIIRAITSDPQYGKYF